MSVETLVFVAVALAGFVALAWGTHAVLGPSRALLRMGPQGGVDICVSVVFAVFLSWVLLAVSNHRSSLTGIALLALPVCLAGLLFLGVGLFEARSSMSTCVYVSAVTFSDRCPTNSRIFAHGTPIFALTLRRARCRRRTYRPSRNAASPATTTKAPIAAQLPQSSRSPIATTERTCLG